MALQGYFKSEDFFYPCLNPEACLTSGTCQAGYTGLGCTQCSGDLILISDFECSDCAGIGIQVFLLSLGFLFFSGFLVFKYYSDVGATSVGDLSVFAKIFISGCQINSLALLFSYDYESRILDNFLKASEEATSIGTTFLHVGCFFGGNSSTYILESILMMSFPFMMVVLVTCILHILTPSLDQTSEDSDENPDQQDKSPVTKMDTIVAMSSIILFFFHPQLTAQVAAIVRCEQFGPNTYKLFVDVAIECWSAEHVALITTIGLMLGFYVVALPILALAYIMRNRDSLNYLAVNDLIQHQLTIKEQQNIRERDHEILDDQDLHAHAIKFFTKLGFLMVGYETEVAWWELVVTFRKVLMTLVSVLLAHDERVQGLVAEFILMSACIAHVHAHPFIVDDLDVYEFISLVSSSLLFFLGSLSKGAGSYSNFAGVMALVVVATFLILSVALAARLHLKSKDINQTEECVELADTSEKSGDH